MSRMAKDALGRRARRRFSEEFKDGAVRLVLDEGKTIGAVARELDLTASALSLWVQHARAAQTKGKSGLMKEEREELTRLRKENRELRIERDLLKKVSALFASSRAQALQRDHDERSRSTGRRQSAATAVHGRAAESALGWRHQRAADRRERQGVPR